LLCSGLFVNVVCDLHGRVESREYVPEVLYRYRYAYEYRLETDGEIVRPRFVF
jgi:hypothetical protein